MIQIKRNNKVFFTLEDFGEGSKLSYQLMDHHYIILKFTTATPIYFEIGDSVEIPDFGYFELTSSYFPKHNDSDGYDYEMQMDAYYMSWKNKLCKYRPQHGANETSFNLTTTVGVHMNVILGNLKALGLTYNGKDFSVDYTTYNNKAFDVQKRFLIEYGSISILDALNSICSEDALNCEWWIDGSIIYLGYCEMEGQTTFEQNVNVLSMSYSESKSTYITRLYAFGSDRNIPKGYFTGADADVTTDGVATDYLMLPNKEVDSDGFYAKDGYLENVNVVKNDKQAIEGVVMFEEEYPKVESVVSSIKTYDSTVDNEDGTKTTQTFWQVTSTDSFTNSFKESWIKSNLTLGIKFTSGALMGMEFDVSFKVIDKVNYFEIVANDTYGRTLPDGVMCPKVGDKYFLFNWDATKITDTDLIPTAQLSLFDRAKQYYQKTMISNSNFTCTMDGDKFYNDGTYDYHPLGEQVKLINDMFAQVDADGKHYRNSRIIGMEIPLDIPYDHPQYTVGEKAATSRLGKLEDKVDSIKVNGMQIGGIGSGNGGGVYVIGLNDSTPASDSNVYSSRRSRMEFVSRLQDNTAKSTITWEKVQKFFSGLLVGNFNNENGGSWTPDAEGRSHLITDYLEVRMKAIFEELVIKKTSTIGGKEIISPAGDVVVHKVEEVTVTYNNVSHKAYRCYFLAEQEGDAVDNDFAIGDQVRSESFNVRKGTYHKVGNHFYWRLIIGRDEEPVELEGKKYHYIDLSDTDCATASDIPAKGDVLSQCGNRTDVERQNCLIFSAVDTYSPSISLYHGINSYSFANKEYVEYGVNKQTNKAFFNVYGDMYVGDRPTKENDYEGSSYIKYDSAAKQVSIKGKLSAKSTVDGKELSQYIRENSAGGLTEEQVNNLIKNSQVIADLQNQVDGAIETWFYEGVPTLKNAPASSWTTDKDKDTHLGDLYYDNKTGKAYRFAKDGSTYKWTVITDTDIAKALSDAAKAQETADGKMKVFSTQPIPPYQLGDIWVNATYPTDGSTYKNEILRCQTAKAKGSSFAIADWTKASKYTDDSALNSFKEEYKNDMASYKEQLDEKVETWFYNYAPTTQNKPASDWTTDTLKSQHAGDLFYNTSNGYTYRWTGTAWARIKDNDINTAMTAASKAQDTADGKRTVFTSQPTVPYDEGDLWASGGDDGKTLMVCVKSRVTGSFTSSEWVKADDSDLNAFAKTIEESLNGIRDQLDKKAETWYQPSDPSASWTTDDAKKEHKGDLWYNTSNNQTFFWNGTKWDKQDVPTEVFDKIDGKSSIYVSKPASYEERDLWILEAAYTLGGVAYSKGELVVATKTNASFSAADWTKKVKYTDDTVANAAKKAAEEAKKAADTAQTNVTNLGKTVTSNKKAFDNYIKDGYLEPSEIAAMAQDSKRLEDAFAAAEKSYNVVKGAEVLANTKELTDLKTAFATLTTAKKELIKYLSDISKRYNAADTNGKATIVSAVGTKFTNFQSAYSAFYDKLGLANAYITSKIYSNLGVVIGDVTSLAYLKKALMDAPDTEINGGLVLTSLIGLRDTDGNTTAGINGITEKSAKGGGIAAWFGGEMVDKDYNDGSKTPANTIFRFDGSGYVAGGAIWWGTDGRVHADPTSFIISEKNLGAYLTFFEPTWKSGSAGTSVADLVSLKPNAPFSKLGVSGDATFEGAITFHGISITYDATNKAIKIDGNLYATGGITAYGAGTPTSTGGGLNGSVKSYADALKLTSESLSEVASAYSIKQLSTRITSLEGGSATSISVSGSGNAVTSVTKNGTTISVVKGATFLTSHQSLSAYLKSADAEKTYSKLGHTHAFSEITGKPTTLAGYGVTDGVNAVSVTGNGNAVTSASIDGHTLTLTKGSTFSLSGHTHTFASLTSKPTTIAGYGITDAYTKAQVDSTIAKYLPLAGGTITGALTVNGIATFKSKVAIGDIYIINDGSGNLYVQKTDGKTAANFYATGGITAFGASSVSGGTGSGLNGSVLGFEKATAMTSADNGDSSKTEVSFLATAWSIKQLNDKINAFGTGVFSDYLTIAAAKATYQPKGSYLTSHQTIYGLTIQKNGTSLGTYTPNSAAKTINVTVPTKLSELSNDSGYTKNTGTVTSVAISVPTGLSVSSSPITTNGTIAIALASGYSIPTTAKQTAWDGAVSAKHTHSNKSVLDGISSTKVSHWNSAYDWYALMTTDEETADGIINKWNEVVSFLANIAQTDTLSGIVDGINKSISDEVARAKKAEGVNASGISANKGSIATLQGYFTNGSAKKALQLTNARKLWGNSFNGTADINGSIIVPSGKYISIGNIKLEYDAANKALKITNTTTEEVANLYTSGGVSAYGVGASSSSGGGLSGSAKAYSDAIRLTTENLSEIASAYSVAKLYSEIQNVASAVPSISVSVPTGGNALTGATYDASTGVITFAKGTFLTAHQSLDGYVNAIAVSGSGNAVTAVTKSGKTITFTKGATYLTSHQSLSNYYTKSSVDSLLNGKSATTHTHSVKINGVTKTIAATGGTAVDLGTYLTSHQSLNGYATQSWVKSQGYLTSHQDVSVLTMANDRYYSSGQWGINMRNSDIIGVNSIYTNDVSETTTEAILFFRSNGNYDGIRAVNGVLYFSNNVVRTTSKYDAEYEVYHKGNLTKLSQLTNDKNYVTGSVSGQTITINGVSTTWQNTWRGITDSYSGTSTGTSLSQKGANSLYNALHNGYASSAGNADTVDGEHASAFTRIVGRHTFFTSGTAPYNYIHLFRIANSDGYSTLDCEIDIRTRYHSAKIEIRISTAEHPYNNGGCSISIVKKVVSGRTCNLWFLPTVQSSNYNYYDVYYESGAWNSGSYGITLKGTNGTLVFEHKGTKLTSLPDKVSPVTDNVAASATKLATARNIALGHDFRGSANFDGTGNVTINGHINAAIISIGSTDPSPFKRIAHVQVPSSWTDNALLLYLSQGYVDGCFGICRVEFRTNNVSEAGSAGASVKWLFRYGYAPDYVQVGFYSAKNNSYMDVFVKTTGGYQGTVIRCLQDSRGSINSNVSLLKATATTEAYTSIEAAATALYKLAYTAIVKGSDAGAVNYANSAGNAGTLDGIHANGLFTNLSNNGNNLSITIGGTNKTLTVGYATKAAQLNTARTLWGQSFDGTGNVNGTLINTNSAGSETIIRCSNTNGQIDLLTSVNRGVYDRTKTRWLIGTNGANSWLDCGNVGIGTTAPAYKLDVSGDARATNFRGALVGNAATATKLQTARTIWGQSFNGTANVSGSITGVNNITMSNNSYLYGKNTGGTAIQLIAMASWNSVDIGRGALTYGYTTQVMGKTVALTASDDSGKNTKSVELSTAKLYSNVNIETEGGLLAHGGVTAYSSSDIRLKQDLRKLDYLGIIKAMGGTFGFAWKKDNTRSIGWIAQHVLCNPHLKDIVETDEKGYYKINYWSPKLIATAFGAIEQVGDEVSRLKTRVVFLESEVQRLSGKQDGNNKKRLDNKNINLLN
jgi:hypothetical protein